MPRALLITYEFPPMGGVGVQRPFQFAKQLPPLGVDVTVVTVDDPPSAMCDAGMLEMLPSSVVVRRAWSLEPTRLIQWLRRRRSAGKRGVGGPAAGSAGAGVTRLPGWLIRAVQALFIPDEKRLWRGSARREALAAIDSEGADVLISSGPPFTAHLVAHDVARATGLPWIADFRDPWVGNYFFVPPTPVHARLQARWEQRIVQGASRVVVVSDPMAVDLRARYSEEPPEKFITVPNGFDRAELPSEPKAASTRFTVVYLGAFQAGITPRPFLAAVKKASDCGDLELDRFRFLAIGPCADEVMAIAGEFGIDEVVEPVGFLPHVEALRLASTADVALLVLTPGPESRAIVTGKLPEYLGLGLTVLALAPESAAAEIVIRADAGPVVAPANVDGIAAALADLYGRWERHESLPTPEPKVVSEFDRSVQMARVADLVSSLVAQ